MPAIVKEQDGVSESQGTDCQENQTAVMNLHERPLVDSFITGSLFSHQVLELEEVDNGARDANAGESKGMPP
jgi:hypothetical protein